MSGTKQKSSDKPVSDEPVTDESVPDEPTDEADAEKESPLGWPGAPFNDSVGYVKKAATE